MAGFTRRSLIFAAGAAAGVGATKYLASSNPVLDGTMSTVPKGGEGVLNDASGLSETPIHKHIVLKQDPGDALVEALRAELTEARAEGRPVNIGAARHSMGGQAIPRDGHAITFDNGFLEPDTGAETYRVHSGARWSQVIDALDPIGYGPKVMQSNHDFGVAATYSVNAHGWPVPMGPMGHTVRSVQMVLPDRELVTCSRDENADLFGMAMGGYGLTGLITEMEVEMTANQRLMPEHRKVPAVDLAKELMREVKDADVPMAYGRMNVDRARFFEDGLVISYRPTPDQDDLPAAVGSGLPSKIASRVYRYQLGNERWKRWRWTIETDIGPAIASGASTRNSLMNEPVHTLDDRNPGRTDILHEYFVAPERFPEFVQACQDVIPASYQEFLNITLRYVAQDDLAWLSYAPTQRIAAVMSFSQEMTERAEADMARMTTALIERILAIGGSYYLPYRLHATQDQFQRCYPRAAEFAAKKRELDPGGVLRNALWDNYMEAL